MVVALVLHASPLGKVFVLQGEGRPSLALGLEKKGFLPLEDVLGWRLEQEGELP